ncbi:hypothetical protein P43SY_006383 [Pythium insidiosum]|uniref:RRM domain-containing protein n=1 Tax=Pythium insidiosum TaxID=114742 RepID=A0AAD5QB04_PYTIN|nr:hypothetical protein P43SY_006383 [Pythium insidiosum]
MSKKIAAKLDKLRGEEWDSDSDNETSFENNDDFVTLEPAETKQQAADEAAARKAAAKGKSSAAASGKAKASNVIYLGRIPHGFYEDQMRGFFQQFGAVKRLRLSRNKRTGKSKHYAFIQFEEAEVAQVVADTMNGYRLFDHVLSSHIIPVSAIHERMFVGANKTFKPLPWRSIARNKHNAERTYEQTIARNKRLVKKEKQKREVLAALGIDYSFPGYQAHVPQKKQHVVFT